ncbi:nitroreductase family protein, partial [Phocaeicola coprocola]|uniref:nitroreductase family protein n=1 Tax=Phocaeicola coprocola TaxID=310298 RepID=UPI003F7DEF44
MNFLELVKARYSVRNYEERPIEQNKLDYIMECVRLAPSAVNFQPWKFAVITEKKLLEALKSAYPREWIKTAPCIIVACGDHNVAWHRKLDNKDHTDVDVSIAVEHLCLAAAEQGLGTCWVCNFDVPLCKEILYCTPKVRHKTFGVFFMK